MQPSVCVHRRNPLLSFPLSQNQKPKPHSSILSPPPLFPFLSPLSLPNPKEFPIPQSPISTISPSAMDSEDDLHYSTDVESLDDDCDFYSGDMDMGMGYYSDDDDDPDAEDFVEDDTDDYFDSRRREVWFSDSFNRVSAVVITCAPSLLFLSN